MTSRDAVEITARIIYDAELPDQFINHINNVPGDVDENDGDEDSNDEDNKKEDEELEPEVMDDVNDEINCEEDDTDANFSAALLKDEFTEGIRLICVKK